MARCADGLLSHLAPNLVISVMIVVTASSLATVFVRTPSFCDRNVEIRSHDELRSRVFAEILTEHREHVFDTFREMGENRKLQGLGLSICQAIVKLLGGRIWLDEEYTDGSRFVFELPK